jgi:hypothetical protein
MYFNVKISNEKLKNTNQHILERMF